MAAQATTTDPWCELPQQERKRILQDMWAAALISDLDMRDDDEADAEAAAACAGFVPASKKVIAELYTPTWDETCRRSRADHDGCAVCLEGLEMGQEFRMMPCSHTFHQLCIFKWLVVNRLCPICKFALPPSEEDDEEMLEEEEEEDYAAADDRYWQPMFINFINSGIDQ